MRWISSSRIGKSHQPLSYRTFLNGALLSNIVINMTQAATDTIEHLH